MQPRILELRTSILKKNDALARQLRGEFARHGLLVVNVVSAPGSGKTALLTRTLTLLNRGFRTAAIVGDLATENDARRLAASGSPTRQILTGTMCHLEADMVAGAVAEWDLSELDFLFIENVGNLVCPTSWDLGEDVRVLLCATTEGEDKPLKYPTLINSADVVVVSKLDLAAAIEFDVALLLRNIDRARPGVPVFQLSSKTGEGLEEWIDYLTTRLKEKQKEGSGFRVQGSGFSSRKRGSRRSGNSGGRTLTSGLRPLTPSPTPESRPLP